jgi:glutathione S-transferase
MVLQVYLDPCTINCRKVLVGLDMLGTQFTVNHIDFFKGQQKSPEYLKINPCATIPAAVDDGPAITESNAILMYAADKGGDSPLYPQDPQQRAVVNRWLFWESSVWFPCCYAYLVENVVKPLLKSQPDQAVLGAQAPTFHKLAAVLEGQLSSTKWLTGDHITIADVAVAAPMHLHAAANMPFEKYPNVVKWMTEGVEKLPSWRRTQQAVEKALLPHRSTHSRVTASINYTKDVQPQLTELYFYDSPESKRIHEPGDDPREVSFHNAWLETEEITIDKQGFAHDTLVTNFEDWEDEKAVQDGFYPEVVEFLKQRTGARRVLVFDHTIRTRKNEAKKLTQETNTSQRAPVMLVHCDYTHESAPLRVRQLLPGEASDLLSRRVAFINVWKPLHNVVEERPLAMCDVRSSQKEDFFKLHLRYRERNGENYVMRYNPRHKWFYFPRVTPEEVILLKTYDSETDGRARFVGHSAFTDPTTPSYAPARESVEIRTILFF